MKIVSTEISDVKLISTARHSDDRGWFSETYRADRLASVGVDVNFVQDNQSFSIYAGTIRGIHLQTPPFAQAKLVRVLAGAIWDVAVDLRRSSPTFGKHVAVRLDAEKCDQLYIPVGFGHAFCTLETNTVVSYKVSAYYSREHDRNVAYNDPDLDIRWPTAPNAVVLSDKDKQAPRLSVCPPFFD